MLLRYTIFHFVVPRFLILQSISYVNSSTGLLLSIRFVNFSRGICVHNQYSFIRSFEFLNKSFKIGLF